MISIKNLTKAYGHKAALDDVSLDISRGETVVILGHSGSGKSTLLRCIVGLTRFDAGRMEVDEIPVDPLMSKAQRQKNINKIRRRCGTVFQQYHLFPHLTVRENISLAPLNVEKVSVAEATTRTEELLRTFGLSHKSNDRPHQLSGGEQQRVAIARALALNPHYLLYDEPTSALDPVRANEMWSLMAQLAAKGQTQVIVTHQEQIQSALPCRIIRMGEGKILTT